MEHVPLPSKQEIEGWAHQYLGQDPEVKSLRAWGNRYTSDYVHNSEYGAKLNAWKRTDAGKAATKSPALPLGTGGPGPGGYTPKPLSDWSRIQKEFRAASFERDKQFANWTNQIGPRLQKHLALAAGRALGRDCQIPWNNKLLCTC
jgi:hypothetical protein